MIPSALKNCIGSPCEVRTMDNNLLCIGKLGAVGEDTLDILAGEGEQMPLYYYNTPIKMNVFSSSEGRFCLGGNLYIANERFWRVSSVTVFVEFEKRSFFRMHADASVTLLLNPEREATEEELPGRLVQARLMDVSLSGIGFVSRHKFHMGDKVLVYDLNLAKTPVKFSFLVEIRRVGAERKEGIAYGASIEEIAERDLERLSRVIFTLQREEIQRRRGTVL